MRIDVTMTISKHPKLYDWYSIAVTVPEDSPVQLKDFQVRSQPTYTNQNRYWCERHKNTLMHDVSRWNQTQMRDIFPPNARKLLALKVIWK